MAGSDSDFHAGLDEANRFVYQDPAEARVRLLALREKLTIAQSAEHGVVNERLSIVERIQGNFALAKELAQAAAACGRRANDDAAISRACVSLGNIHWSEGNLEEALKEYQAAYQIRSRLDDPAATAGALASIANILSEQGKFDKARDHYERVLSLAHHAGDRRIVARTENNLSECLLELGFANEALNHAQSALKVCRQLGDQSEVPNVLVNMGRAQMALRFWADTAESIRTGTSVARDVGDRRVEAVLTLLRAKLLHARPEQDLNETYQDAEDEALVLAQEIGAKGLQKTILQLALTHARAAKDVSRELRLASMLKSL